MTWKEYTDSITLLGEKINKEFQPDIIIAIARGGWIPTRYLSDLLAVKNITSIGIKYADETRTNLVTYSNPTLPKNCRKILLVEDMLESGKSIQWAWNYYKNLGYEVKSTCLFILEETKFIPDYYLKKIDGKIMFPWEEKND